MIINISHSAMSQQQMTTRGTVLFSVALERCATGDGTFTTHYRISKI